MGYGEVQGVTDEIRGKEAVEDQPLHSPPHHALQLCFKALARSRAGGGTPKNRDGVSDGEQEREGESSWAGEMGLGIAARAGAPKLRLCMSLALLRCPGDVDFGSGHSSLLLELWCLWSAVVLAHGSCFSFSPDAWFGYDRSLRHRGLLPRSEGWEGVVAGGFPSFPFQ